MDLFLGVNGELCGSSLFLCVVVFACNSGVETGPGATGSDIMENNIPSNLNVKDK